MLIRNIYLYMYMYMVDPAMFSWHSTTLKIVRYIKRFSLMI